MIVHPVIYNLEQLRNQLNDLNLEINQRLDSLDRGNLGEAEFTETQEVIKHLRGEASQIRIIFENTISQVLMNRPKLVRDWANRHISFYREILTELEAELPPNETQIFLAKEVIQHWEEVLGGERLFALDPPYLIVHYHQRQKDFFGLDEYNME